MKQIKKVNKRKNFRELNFAVEDAIVSFNKGVVGRSFFRELREMAKFLYKNKSEFIILRFQQETEKMAPYLKACMIANLETIFKGMLVTQKDRIEWFKTDKVTIGDLRLYKKNVLIVFRKEIFIDFPLEILKDLRKSYEEKENEKDILESPIKTDVEEEKEKMDEMMKAKKILKSMGYFDKNSFLRDFWKKTEKSEDLIEMMEGSYNQIEYRQFRVNYYCFSPENKFKLGYFFKPPTVYLLDKEQFHKGHGVLTHLVESIDQNFDVNIGNCFISSYFFISKNIIKLLKIK